MVAERVHLPALTPTTLVAPKAALAASPTVAELLEAALAVPALMVEDPLRFGSVVLHEGGAGISLPGGRVIRRELAVGVAAEVVARVGAGVVVIAPVEAVKAHDGFGSSDAWLVSGWCLRRTCVYKGWWEC